MKNRFINIVRRVIRFAGIAIDLSAYALFRLREKAVGRIVDRLDIGNL